MQEVSPILFLVGIALLGWLLLIRPQQRRQRELRHMQSTLEVGDEVMLTSGVFGVLRATDESEAHVEIADGVVIRVVRGAIGSVAHEAAHEAGPEVDQEADHEGEPLARPVAGPDDAEGSEEKN